MRIYIYIYSYDPESDRMAPAWCCLGRTDRSANPGSSGAQLTTILSGAEHTTGPVMPYKV